ncbi:hypothetical protein [Microcoleus sp. bin38.metabat.b11b12b14.051]|uniref:hypothetical protein n=1 Tax=Microcoleus sp. bin38.metabat.b11b12b14.051 TaxID=2742709 RepID=UPI0025E341CE|nr:hypothetical protein [Microcoleus sp. bin38.metabat.b11b12b14.051]
MIARQAIAITNKMYSSSQKDEVLSNKSLNPCPPREAAPGKSQISNRKMENLNLYLTFLRLGYSSSQKDDAPDQLIPQSLNPPI